jgi:hypothetical protein
MFMFTTRDNHFQYGTVNAREYTKITVYQIVTINMLVKMTFVIYGTPALPGRPNTTSSPLKNLANQIPLP